MGEISDLMTDGSLCHYCGVYLEPKERVFLVYYERKTNPQVRMPDDGSEFGVPVICYDCYIEPNQQNNG